MRAAIVLAMVAALGACSDMPDGVTLLTADPATRWAALGAFPLTPPIALPTQARAASRTTVWLAIPDGARIDVDERGHLRWPIGATADRVEEVAMRRGWAVADVRGETLTAEGGRFHLMRPERPGMGAMLTGYAWPRDVASADTWVHAAMANAMEDDGVGMVAADASAERRAAMADGLRNRAGCARCHQATQPIDLSARALVHRGTDTAGWYVPESVLLEEAPIERYRPDDPNEGPFVRVRCPSGEATRDVRASGRAWRCADGATPIARFDVAAAMAAGDAHARAVCASRRWLAVRMTQRARDHYAAALTPCRD